MNFLEEDEEEKKKKRQNLLNFNEISDKTKNIMRIAGMTFPEDSISDYANRGFNENTRYVISDNTAQIMRSAGITLPPNILSKSEQENEEKTLETIPDHTTNLNENETNNIDSNIDNNITTREEEPQVMGATKGGAVASIVGSLSKENEGLAKEHETTEESNEVSSNRKEAVNVIMNGNKPNNLITEKEKLQDQQKKEENVKNIQEANLDKNIFSQIGKTIENLWLGIVGGGKTATYYASNPNHTKQQELSLLAGKRNDIVANEYINQLNESGVNLISNVQKNKNSNINLSLRKEEPKTVDNGIYTPKILDELNEAKDAFGNVEINGLRRDLSKSIAEDQNKIASNINEIDTPWIKKIAELAPSIGNSLVGAGLHLINPYLSMSYFIISASGSYEFEGRNRGMSKEEARQYGTIMGYMEGATEYLEVSNFVPAQISSLSKGKFVDFLKNVGLDMADNAVQEAIIDPVDELVAYVTSKKSKYDYSTKEGWQQLGKDMIEDGFNGALSSILMGGITGGIGSSIRLYDKIRNGENITNQELKNTLSDIQKNGIVNIKDKFKDAFNFQKEKLENNNEKIYTIANIDAQGNLSNLTQAMGEDINIDNDKLTISPAVVYTDGYYNIIDSKSGLMIDSTMYGNKENAINSFKEKISNVDNATINEINRRATISQLLVIDKFQELQEKTFQNPEEVQKQTRIEFVQDNKMYTQQEAQQIFNDFNMDITANNRQYLGQELNDMITNNVLAEINNENNIQQNNNNSQVENSNNITTVNQLKEFSKMINQIQDNSRYSRETAIEVLESTANKIKNINLVKQSDMFFVNSLNKDGSISYQQKIDKNRYTGAKIKTIINNAINNADLSDINISDNTNIDVAQTLVNQNTDNLNSKTTSYTSEKIKSIIEPFSNQEEYTIEEMANIWNNEIDNEDLQSVYDDKGNLQGYVSIQEDGDNLVVNNYDSNDNIISSEVIPSQNGNYTSKAIKDTIEKVTGLYEQNKASGTQDINTINLSDNEIRDIVKYNPDGREITDQDYVDFMFERYKDNKNISGIKIDTNETNEILSENVSKNEKLRKLYYKIKQTNNIPLKINLKNANTQQFESIKLDIDITLSGLRESFTKSNKLEKYAVVPYLDQIIKTVKSGDGYFKLLDNKARENIKGYAYLFNTAIIDNKLYSIKMDIKRTEMGDRFYVHRVNMINNERASIQASNSLESYELVGQEAPSIDTSISQKDTNVKSDTAINNKSMQVDKNYTPDSNIKSMKKSTNKLAKTGNIKYNSNGIKLGKKEYANVVSAINTDNPNLSKAIHGKFFDNSYYIFEKFDFDNYNFLGKIGIQNNEDLINMIIGGTKNGTLKGTKNVTRTIAEFVNGRGINNTNNDSSERTRENIQTTGIRSRYDKSGQGNNQKRNNNQSLRNQSGGLRGRGELSNNDNIRSMKAKNTVETDNRDIRYMKANKTQNVKNDEVHFNKRTAQSKATEITQRNAERQGSYIEEEIKKLEATGNWDTSIPRTSLTDIRKTIENYLGLGIKKGHFRQQAYAIYKGNRDVLRTKEYKDMDSILHETGHALDIGNRLKIDKESIADELLKAIDKLGGYESETRTVRLEEGFAEVIREYSVIPSQAKIDYPQTIAILEKLRQNDKSFNNFIEKVQQQTYNYIHQDPRNRTLSNISIGEQTDKTPFSKEILKEEFIRKVWDKDYLIKSAVSTLQKANGKTVNQLKASDNAYYLTRLMNGIGDKVSSMLADGYIDENGNKLMPGLNQIGEILDNDPLRFDDLRAYLVARRDTDYRNKALKTGLRNNDSLAVIEQFKNDKQIQKATQLIYDTLDGVMQYAINNRLITQETANALKESNAFYVPMQRVLESRGNQVGRKGAVQEFLKKRTGSELDIKDILENVITNSSNIIQQVENNNVLKALYNQGEQSGLTGAIYDVIDTPMTKIGTDKLETWKSELERQGVDTTELDLEKTIDLFAPDNKVDRQHLITSFIDDTGKRVYLQFNDKVLFESFMGLDTNSMSYLLRLSSHMNMPLRYGATMANIGFAIPNMISDTAQATIFSTAGFVPVVDNAIGVLDILAVNNKTVRNFLNQVAPGYADKINNLYTIYQQTGATNATRLSQYRKSTQNIMKDIYGTKNSKNLGVKESFRPLKRLLDIMTYIPELSEQSTRFRVFQRNYDYYLKKGNSETDARIMAALESRDATQDFSRTGTVTREINQLIPFSAARVGSSYTFAEKVKANPKQVATRIALLTIIAMGIKALGYDDDEIEEVNQRKKDDNFVLRMGDNIVTIKKPQGILRSMINLAEYIQDLATGHIEEGKEGERLSEWINNAIMDNMPADEVTGLVPNMVAPLIENKINKDFYYNTDIVKSYDLDLPDSQQYYEYNSQLAILLGQVFNYSPAKIDNLISGYFGTLGTSITNLMDMTMGKLGMTTEKPEMGAENTAVGKRFIVNVNSNSASVDEIYNRKTELTKKKNGETITDEESQELDTITQAISNMSKINKQIKEIKKDLSMSGKQKADKIKLLQEQRTDIARKALGKELIHPENKNIIESTEFYPTNSSLSKNNYKLELNSDMKKEYEKCASDYYNKYAKQGLYNEEKLNDIKSKAKDYAKNELFKKYKSNLVKSK